MRCTHCGAEIPEGMLICPDCRTEVQMVPDYNPLDDVLAREVRGSVEDATRPIRQDDIRRYREQLGGQAGNATRVLSQGELDHIRTGRTQQPGSRTEVWRQGNGASRTRVIGGVRQENIDGRRRTTGEIRGNTGRVRQNTGEVRRTAEEKRRQQQARKKRALRRRMQAVFIVLLFLAVVLGGSGFILYQNSYTGIVAKGYRSLQTGEYSAAQNAFNRAIAKDSKRAEAYSGMADIYIQQKTPDKAEDVFLKAIDAQPTNAELYQAAIDFYVKTEQLDKISSLLEGCDDSVLSAVSAYVSEMPVFSLEEGTYSEVQQVALSGEGTLYYTTDGTEPTENSTKYEEPILLEEGTTTVRAVAINKKGVPSLIASRNYTIELPIEGAPAVTPSTGVHPAGTQITIQVPEGYKAYYTIDGSVPSAASTLYQGPIEMPFEETGGRVIFSAVLISDNGKMTQITKRTYEQE